MLKKKLQQRGFSRIAQFVDRDSFVIHTLNYGLLDIEERKISLRRSPRNHNKIPGILNGPLASEDMFDVIDRSGRLDIVLTQKFWTRRPSLVPWKLSLEKSILPELGNSKLRLRTTGFLVTPPQTRAQAWHCDAATSPKYSYFTVFLALTPSTKVNGATQFKVKTKVSQPELNIGDILLFDGSVTHRGMANKTHKHRISFYLVYAVRKKDPNIAY